MNGIAGGDDVSAVVFDIGSKWVRTGFAGEESPKFQFPTSCGTISNENQNDSKKEDKMEIEESKKYYIGNQSVNYRRDNMEIENPLKDGLIHKWDIYEEILNHSFNYELNIQSNEHAVMLSEVPFTTREQREKTISLLFEKFKTPACFLAKSPVLSTFACGKTTGIVVDSGAGTTVVTPVHDGYALISSLIKNHEAGDSITQKILELIEKKIEIKPNWSFKKTKEQDKFILKDLSFPKTRKSFINFSKYEIVEEIKHSMFQISESHFDASKQTNFPQISFELNTGNSFDFGMERYSIPEVLFSPENQSNSIPQMCYDSIMKSDADIRKELFSNIILVGGNTNFNGFAKRFEKDLTSKVTNNIKIKTPILPPSFPASKQMTWIGGSILSSLGSFQQMWISKEEFEEVGPQIIHKKCP